MFLSREGRDLEVAFQDPPGCQASSRGEAKDSSVLPSRDADLAGGCLCHAFPWLAVMGAFVSWENAPQEACGFERKDG